MIDQLVLTLRKRSEEQQLNFRYYEPTIEGREKQNFNDQEIDRIKHKLLVYTYSYIIVTL